MTDDVILADPLVLNDPHRLDVLYSLGLLDAPPQPALDRLTHLAARIMDSPIAALSLIDQDRQFYASYVGIDQSIAPTRELPLIYSCCQHVVGTGRPLIVGNAAKHPLLATNRAVTEYGLLSYLGMPLTIGGQTIGSFCVMGQTPRRWQDYEVDIMREMADTVTTTIELHTEYITLSSVETAVARSEQAASDYYANIVVMGITSQRMGDLIQDSARHIRKLTELVDRSRRL